MQSSPSKWVTTLAVVVLAYAILLQVQGAWQNYWLLTDGKQGTATVVRKHWSGHSQFVYQYTVNEGEYSDVSHRDLQDSRYSNVQAGDQAIVYYSASRPWISLLYEPPAIFMGLPLLPILVVLELYFLASLFKPNSKWALGLGSRRTGQQGK